MPDAAVVSWPADAKKPKTRRLHSLAGHGALDGAFRGLLFFIPLIGAAMGAGDRPHATRRHRCPWVRLGAGGDRGAAGAPPRMGKVGLLLLLAVGVPGSPRGTPRLPGVVLGGGHGERIEPGGWTRAVCNHEQQ
ncbi:hypothetical protein AB0M34_18635 [Nocardia sp. NPDC050193]